MTFTPAVYSAVYQRGRDIMKIETGTAPELDPHFVPAVAWNRAYRQRVGESGKPQRVIITLIRPDGTCSAFETAVLPLIPENEVLSLRYLERILKFLLWQRGGCRVLIAGCDALTQKLSVI